MAMVGATWTLVATTGEMLAVKAARAAASIARRGRQQQEKSEGVKAHALELSRT
jgi:hypothetical protein